MQKRLFIALVKQEAEGWDGTEGDITFNTQTLTSFINVPLPKHSPSRFRITFKHRSSWRILCTYKYTLGNFCAKAKQSLDYSIYTNFLASMFAHQ